MATGLEHFPKCIVGRMIIATLILTKISFHKRCRSRRGKHRTDRKNHLKHWSHVNGSLEKPSRKWGLFLVLSW